MTLTQEISINTLGLNLTNRGAIYKSELENFSRGLRIKFHRIDQGLSLKDLAAGNLSQENLRLAEMSQFEIDSKVYKKLCLRLGIPLEPVINPVGEESILKFKSMLTHIKSRPGLVKKFAEIQVHPTDHLKEVYRLELMIHSIRYYVVTGDVVSALAKYNEAARFRELMDAQQLFFLNKYRGNIYYADGHYREAINLYKGCLTSAPLDLPNAEMADLYYTLGISSGQLVEPQDSKSYSEKALALYQDMFYPKRIVECHVCISLAEHRVCNFKSGMNHIAKAAMILEEIHLPELHFLVEYNYGYFYFLFHEFEATIHHMEKCLEIIEDGNVIEELRVYTALMKANWELGRKDAALNWCDLGTRSVIEMEESSLSNQSVAEVFYQFQLVKALLHDNHDRFEYLAEEEVLPHFAKNGYNIDYAYYCTMVADYYSRVGKNDKAMKLYKQSGDIYRQVISIH